MGYSRMMCYVVRVLYSLDMIRVEIPFDTDKDFMDEAWYAFYFSMAYISLNCITATDGYPYPFFKSTLLIMLTVEERHTPSITIYRDLAHKFWLPSCAFMKEPRKEDPDYAAKKRKYQNAKKFRPQN